LLGETDEWYTRFGTLGELNPRGLVDRLQVKFWHRVHGKLPVSRQIDI
jgi:hypothetical protein